MSLKTWSSYPRSQPTVAATSLSPHGTGNKARAYVSCQGTPGDGHEVLVSRCGNLYRSRRHWKSRSGAKLSVVRHLQRWSGWRRHKLRICDVRSMHGDGARARQLVPAKYAICASTRTPSLGKDETLSILSAARLMDGAMTDAETDALCDEEALINEISDQALERACGYNSIGASTLIISSYCFTCVSALRSLFPD
jgi:hypothetical protein